MIPPLPRLRSDRQVAQQPAGCMIGIRQGSESEIALDTRFLQIALCVFDAVFRMFAVDLLRNPDRTFVEALQTDTCGSPVGTLVIPPYHAVEMAVTEKSRPERGDAVVVQTDVKTADCASRKTGKHDPVAVSSITAADVVKRCDTVSHRFFDVAPPLRTVLFVAFPDVDIRETDPNRLARRQAVTDVAVLDRSERNVGRIRVSISGIFNYHGQFFAALPVFRKKKRMIDAGVFPARRRRPDTLSGSRSSVYDRRGGNIRRQIIHILSLRRPCAMPSTSTSRDFNASRNSFEGST